MPKKYTEEFKKQVVVSYQNGMSIQELCQKNRIAHSTLYRWLREYGADAEGPTRPWRINLPGALRSYTGQRRRNSL